ncbi:MAG: OmpA family protein [Bacteroidota bacterium]
MAMKRLKNMLRSSFAGMALVTIGGLTSAHAQQAYDGAVWRVGIHGGMNFNIGGLGSQSLNAIQPGVDQFTTKDIMDGTALGFYFGALTEYNPGGLFGGKLRLSVDDRRVDINDWDVPGNSRVRFSAKNTYFSVEPMLQLQLGSPNFHFAAGPLLSFLISSKYDFIPRDETSPTISGQDIDGMKKFTYGVSSGLSYDILLNSKSASNTKWYLTPFLEYSYMMAQRESNVSTTADRNDTWVTNTIRGGFELKFGSAPAAPAPYVEAASDMPTVDLALRAPSAITEERTTLEMFPLRNYLFFEPSSTSLPVKYVSLSNQQAQGFREQSLVNDPGTGGSASLDRSQRQMSVYYNAVNIYGDRLRNNPSAKITLIGGAPSQSDALTMANSVKDYLVSSFGIDAARISTKGVIRTPNASGTRVTPKEDLPFVAEENRRVEVQSEDLSLLRPVTIETRQSSLPDNDLVINVTSSAPLADYSVAVNGNGYTQTYGPYHSMNQRIDARPMLMGSSSGTYTATVTAHTNDNQTITRQQTFSLSKLTTPPVTGQRYSILFEYDESKTVQTYESFLRQDVAPKIPNNATVVIHGHTDKIGLEDYNLDLSSKRAMETQNVLQDELRKMGRTVTFDPYGFGEDPARAPFTNETPEGRYYDRTVMIEVIPAQ